MAKYGIFESTMMGSTHYAERILDCISENDVENGTFGYIEELAEGESVVYTFHPGVKAGAVIVVADQPAWDPDTSRITNQRKDKFIIKAGTRFRVRVVKLTDTFAISAECVTTATRDVLDVDAYLTIDTSTGKLVASTTKTSGAAFEAQVRRKRNSGATLVTTANTYGYSAVLYEAVVTTLSNEAGTTSSGS